MIEPHACQVRARLLWVRGRLPWVRERLSG